MKTILGVNHQFVYPDSMVNEKVHTKTLKSLSETDLVSALDCWCWRGESAKEEIKILKDSGKFINYNIGDRFGEKISLPASKNEADRIYAYDTIMREIGYALELGSKKIVFASGPDYPDDRDGAKERFLEFVLKVSKNLPEGVSLAFEPTDRDIDKHFLFGPMNETVDFIHKVRNNGFENFGLLIDMCHVPIMHETLESAVEKAEDTLIHIHLGNCMIKDKESVYYGDKHIPWDYPNGEYTSEDGIKFIKLLKDKGYFEKENTVSFEMRPVEGLSGEESLAKWVDVWNKAVKKYDL